MVNSHYRVWRSLRRLKEGGRNHGKENRALRSVGRARRDPQESPADDFGYDQSGFSRVVERLGGVD